MASKSYGWDVRNIAKVSPKMAKKSNFSIIFDFLKNCPYDSNEIFYSHSTPYYGPLCAIYDKNAQFMILCDKKYKTCPGYIPISSSTPRLLGAAYVPILLSEVKLGAGLCDGEGECAYTLYAPHYDISLSESPCANKFPFLFSLMVQSIRPSHLRP